MENKLEHANAYTGDIVYVTTDKITADKCEVVHSFLQYPKKVVVKSLATGDTYSAYPEWHCYKTEEDAKAAAERYKKGHRDIIY